MRRAFFILLVCFVSVLTSVASIAAEVAGTDAPELSCGNGVPGGVYCIPSKNEIKQARNAYNRGRKLQKHNREEEALAQFDQASRLVPQDLKFLSAWELTKSQLAFQHTQRGETLLVKGQREAAAAEFRAALKLDSENTYVQGRLADAVGDPASANLSGLSVVSESTEIELQPKSDRATFHYHGDIRGLFSELTTAYGIKVEFDDSVTAKTVRFYVDDVDFMQALSLACKVSKTMWSPLSSHQLLIAANTAENHKQFDRMSLATLAVPGANTPQQTTEVVSALRNVCEFQKMSTGQGGTLEIRAPQAMLHACTELLRQINDERPEVMLDIEIYQISHNFTREIGMHVPNTFNLYNIPVAALAGLGGQSIQSLVNQLVSSGGINQAGSSALSGLLAQLQGQANSIFSQPLATFGGGLTFSGLSLDHLTAALSLNESWARSLSHASLRSSQGEEATFHLGERYPILNASYAPIYNSPQIASVIGNQSYVAPFPSISYEDLGLQLKAKPVAHGNGEISMTLEMQLRSLTGQSANGVPVIANSEYHGSIRLRDGEPAVVAGEITTNDQRSMEGIPAIAEIPGINLLFSDTTKMKEDDELLIVMTPHIIANRGLTTSPIWVGSN
jgi:general secretion pathway protein D